MGFVSLPYTPVDGDTITATNTLNDLNAIVNVVNGHLDTTNLSATAGIVGTQLSSAANILGTQLSSSANIAITQLNPTTALAFKLTSGTSLAWSATATGYPGPSIQCTADGAIGWTIGGSGSPDVTLSHSGSNTLTINGLLQTNNLTVGTSINTAGLIASYSLQCTGTTTLAATSCTTLTVNSLTIATPLSAKNGGTGVDLSASVNGSVPYISSGALTVLAGGASVANKAVGWNGTGTALVALTTASAPTVTLFPCSGAFTCTGQPSFTNFLIDTTGGAASTNLPASPADGTTWEFAIINGTLGATITANGAQTIRYGNLAQASITIPGPSSGNMQIKAITGGWLVT